MRKLFGIICILVLVSSLILTACAKPAPAPAPVPAPTQSPTPTKAPAQVIQWRFWENTSSLGSEQNDHRYWTFPWNYQEGCARILERTNGRLDIKVMTPDQSGLKGPEIARALKDNLIEMADIAMGFLATELPWVGVFDLAYIIPDPYLDNPKLVNALRPWLERLEKAYNFTIVDTTRQHAQKWITLYTKKRINTLDDLKGVKIRIYTPYHEGVLTKVGAVPTFMTMAEVPMALKTGVIDGFMTSMGLGYTMQAAEGGIKYEQGVWAFPGVAPICVSNQALNSLPPDLKQIFLDTWKVWYNDNNSARTYNDLFFNEKLETDRGLGIEIFQPKPEFNATLEKYTRETDWALYEKNAGPDGTEMLNKVLAATGRSR